jgi:hypothetical protein
MSLLTSSAGLFFFYITLFGETYKGAEKNEINPLDRSVLKDIVSQASDKEAASEQKHDEERIFEESI